MREKDPKNAMDRSADAKEAVADFVQVTCARCGKLGTLQAFMIEEGCEGDDWECNDCFKPTCY